MGFLEYWDTRIVRNKRVFDAHPHLANFTYCECERIWGHMEAENKALLARVARLEGLVRVLIGCVEDATKYPELLDDFVEELESARRALEEK